MIVRCIHLHQPHPEEHRQRVRAKRGPMTGSAMRLEGWTANPGALPSFETRPSGAPQDEVEGT